MFTTGQATEGAVNYTASNAVCGEIATGDAMNVESNQVNLTLPASQACAQPIGSKWVASITNWLCYLIDRQGVAFHAGDNCQDPLLLLTAVTDLIQTQINAAFQNCSNSPIHIGAHLVTCDELPSAAIPFVDCENNPISAGAAIATCADLGAIVIPPAFNPFTSTDVGAVLCAFVMKDSEANFTGADVSPLMGDTGTLTVGTGPNFGIGYDSGFTLISAFGQIHSLDERWTTIGAVPGTWKIQSMFFPSEQTDLINTPIILLRIA